MDKVRLSTKGQVVIPKSVRDAHGWGEGQELELVDTPAGVLLRAPSPFGEKDIAEVAGCLAPHYKGPAVSVGDMNRAAARAAKDGWS